MFFALISMLLATQARAAMPDNGLYLNSDGSPLIPLIQSAQQSLDIEIYTMRDPEVRQLLREALSRGVKVRVIEEPEPFGDSCNLFGTAIATKAPANSDAADCQDQKQLMSEIRSAGGTFAPFNKANLCPNGGGPNGEGCYEHGKIAIADGSTLLMSSGNFDNTSLCIASEDPKQCDRDYSYISDDPQMVSTVSAIFDADLVGNSYDPRTLIPSQLQDTLTVSPYSLQPLIDFVNSAQTSIDLETQYLHDPELNQAIENAAKRGVQVNVTLASVCAFGKPSQYDVNLANKIYPAFDNAGISTAMFDASNLINGAAGYMHAKAIVVDGTRAWMGSENGSNESLNENREYGVFFDTPADVQKLLGIIQADHTSADSETWQQSLVCEKDSKSVTDGGTAGGKTNSGSATGSNSGASDGHVPPSDGSAHHPRPKRPTKPRPTHSPRPKHPRPKPSHSSKHPKHRKTSHKRKATHRKKSEQQPS